MPPDLRYRFEDLAERRPGRSVGAASDSLFGRSVFVKRGDAAPLARELRVLLRLPPGVAARPLDFVTDAAGTATLVLERLDGRTLLDLAPELGESSLASRLLDVLDALEVVHRLGLVHGDLKPGNVFVCRSGGARLLDFESVLGAGDDAAGDDARIIGTPPFVAPEVLRGWSVDARADLYSLGMTLRTLFPWVVGHPRWGPLVAKLTDPRPSARYASAAMLASALQVRFSVTLPLHAPAFPAGPMRGRADAVAAAFEALEQSDRVLVQALPGRGVSRFLLELAGAPAAATLRLRLLDLSGAGAAADADAVARVLAAARAAGERVVIGVSDPTPSLAWLPAPLAAVLSEACPLAPRIALPALDATDLTEILASSLGDWRGDLDALARVLDDRTEGDLPAVATLLPPMSDPPDTDALRHSLEARPAPVRPLAEVALRIAGRAAPEATNELAPLLEPLALAARAPAGAGADVVRGLLAALGHAKAYERLVEAGLLAVDASHRVRAATRELRRAALTTPNAREGEVQAWLHAHVEPDPDDADAVFECGDRARALGDPATAARWLAAAIERARERRRWDALLRLLLRGAANRGRLDARAIAVHATQLASQLGAPWTAARLQLLAAQALKAGEPELANALWTQVAASKEPACAAEALVALAESDLRRCDDDAFEQRATMLAALGPVVAPGVLPLKRAWQAQNHGRATEAESLAREAVGHLQGTGSPHELLAFQQLAILCFGRDPAEGVSQMRVALGAARTATERAQVHYNLAMMLERSGDLEACVAEASAGLEQLPPGTQPRLEALLRERRAWGWASLDAVREAAAEARVLLDHRVVRHEPAHRVTVRVLAGFCALHRGAHAAALTDLVAAWRDSAAGCPADLRASSLAGLVDALLDTQEWEFVEQLGAELDTAPEPRSPGLELALARARALRARAADRPAEALAMFEEHDAGARSVLNAEERACWFLHRARVGLDVAGERDLDRIEQSLADAREAAAMLPARGYGFLRARILLTLGESLGRLGRPDAGPTLDEAVESSRAIGARGLLAVALKARASHAIATGGVA